MVKEGGNKPKSEAVKGERQYKEKPQWRKPAKGGGKREMKRGGEAVRQCCTYNLMEELFMCSGLGFQELESLGLALQPGLAL